MTGRPTKYKDEETLKVVKALAECGKTDEEIAEILSVTFQTINNWKLQHPDFFESLKKAKDTPDDKVERSLFERACGYTRSIERLSKTGEVVDTLEEMPPDVTACIFWLKNRRPEKWRDKQDHEHSSKDGNPVFLLSKPLTAEEFEKMYADSLEQDTES